MTAQVAMVTMTARLLRHWLLVPVALLAQLLPPLGLNLLAHAVYEDGAWVTPTTALPLSQWWLVVTGTSGAALAVTAMYASLRQARLSIALPLVLLCVLALGASIFYLYAFLAFQGFA